MNLPTKTEIAATRFLQDPSLEALRALCEIGDFGGGSWTFNRLAMAKVLKEIQFAGDVRVSAGRGLKRTRTYRRVYENGRDVTGVYDASLFHATGRRVTETHHTTIVAIPSFAILVSGPRFEYIFGPTFQPLGDGLDLEELQRKISGP